MSVEANKQLVRDTWGAVSQGDVEGFMSRLADDVTWTFFGSHRFAGTFRGKEELVAKLFAPLGEVLADGIKGADLGGSHGTAAIGDAVVSRL